MHVVIVVTNLPFERDRRVQREALSLARAGHEVTVICPRPDPTSEGPPAPRVAVRAFPLPVEGHNIVTWLVEYVWCLLWVAVLLAVTARRRRVDAVQVCNPPDIFWPLAVVARRLGCAWVFDHHDLMPEMYDAQGGRSPVLHRALLGIERMSVRTASAVVATNESFRDVEITRDGIDPNGVVVVRNGPRLEEVPGGAVDVPTAPPFVISYVGVMSAQDSVDVVLRAAAHIVHRLGRRDCRFVLLGDGPMLPQLRQLAQRLDLFDFAEMPGWASGAEVSRLLRETCVGFQPDQPNALTNLSTMAKTIDYLAHGVPVVAADLIETRRSAADAAVYVSPPTPESFAETICALVDDPRRRLAMSRTGQARVRDYLAWDLQEAGYLRLFQSVVRHQ